MDIHEEFIRGQLQIPSSTARSIHLALKARGCPIGYSVVKDWVRRLKAEHGMPLARPSRPFVPVAAPSIPSSRSLAMNLLQKQENRSEEQKQTLELLNSEAEFQQPIDLITTFVTMVRQRKEFALTDWFQKVDSSSILELKRFAQGLRNDEAAVRAALTLPWSNGQVEGQVNRLKWIKRSMFGRAKFDLLRARVVCKA